MRSHLRVRTIETGERMAPHANHVLLDSIADNRIWNLLNAASELTALVAQLCVLIVKRVKIAAVAVKRLRCAHLELIVMPSIFLPGVLIVQLEWRVQ